MNNVPMRFKTMQPKRQQVGNGILLLVSFAVKDRCEQPLKF